jgi:hypothetical protein
MHVMLFKAYSTETTTVLTTSKISSGDTNASHKSTVPFNDAAPGARERLSLGQYERDILI